MSLLVTFPNPPLALNAFPTMWLGRGEHHRDNLSSRAHPWAGPVSSGSGRFRGHGVKRGGVKRRGAQRRGVRCALVTGGLGSA